MTDTNAPAVSPDPRTVNRSRRLGYRVLPGDAYSYVLHLRPREWPIVAAHVFFGFALAVAAEPTAWSRWPEALLGIALFVVCLNGGTLAINSAFDRDEGDIGYLDAPPPPPPHLLAFGMGLMAFGQIAAFVVLSWPFAVVYAACFVMSVLYSVPPFRWKAVAGLDIAINALGFGSLTAFAGWALADISPPAWAITVLAGFVPLFAALYPLTQLYQFDEDRRRGDRTFALVIGMRASLIFANGTTVLAFALFLGGLWAGPAGGAAAILLIPLAVWLALLLRWLSRYPTMSPAEHKRGMYDALKAWAITTVALLAAAFTPLL